MSKVFIISTRSMNDKKGIWLNQELQIQTIQHDSPFVQNLLKDRDGSYATTLANYLYDIEGWNYDDALSWADETLKHNDLIETLGIQLYEKWVNHTLTKQKRSVSFLSWDQCYHIDKDNYRVIVVQHPPFILSKKESKAWVSALIDTFSSSEDYVCLILHDKDLDGFNNMVSYPLTKDEVQRFTSRVNTDIIAFEHGGTDVSCLFARESIDSFLEGLDTIKDKLIKDQPCKKDCVIQIG